MGKKSPRHRNDAPTADQVTPDRAAPLRLRFPHPEPARSRHRIYPAFITFQGCPGRCIYCAQDAQTGQPARSLPEQHAALASALETALARGEGPLEIGFFGGTFTALPDGWPRRFLELASRYRHLGLVSSVRCSTRPDAISLDELQELKQLGLDTVELGIQSFDPDVLDASRRGYSPALAESACRIVRQAGLSLVVQLLPGLPASTPAVLARDIRTTVALSPKAVRLYPCLVLDATPLAALWRAGRYSPWPLERTVVSLSRALLRLWDAGIPVIRIGLAPEQDMLHRLLAGPCHPAMGFLVRSRALQLSLRRLLRHGPGQKTPPVRLDVPRRYISELLGHKRCFEPALARLGLPPERIRVTEEDSFALY